MRLPPTVLCAAALLAAPPLSHSADPAAPAGAAKGCLPTGNGYLRARIRGAMNLDVNWHNAELQCEGGPRPDGSGLRVAFAGPAHADGHGCDWCSASTRCTRAAPGTPCPPTLR